MVRGWLGSSLGNRGFWRRAFLFCNSFWNTMVAALLARACCVFAVRVCACICARVSAKLRVCVYTGLGLRLRLCLCRSVRV